jgi:DNA-binding transcriptional LysR family regulator
MHMFDWNDLRYVLAVATKGSHSAAAAALGVDHATVGRRLAALERALDTKLFARARGRYVCTDAGETICQFAREMADRAAAIARYADSKEVRMTGTLRITTIHPIAVHILVPRIGVFQARHPGIEIEFLTFNRFLDLANREIDVAIRLIRPESGDVVARRLAEVRFGIYAGRKYVERNRVDARNPDLQKVSILAHERWMGELLSPITWLERHHPRARVVFRSNSVASLVEAAKAGLGVVVLPCFVARKEPSLIRLATEGESLTSDAWLLVHRDLKDTPRIRAFIDFAVEVFHDHRDVLLGEAPTPETI